MAINLDELERLAAQATPGPWVIRHGDGWYNKHSYEIEASDGSYVAETLYAYNGEADAAYITAACNAVPELTAENRALRERVRKMDWQMVWLAKQVCDSFSPQEWINRAEEAAKEAGE